MKLIVDSIFLTIYKDLVEHHTFHTVHCAWHMTEFCDCGLSQKIQQLQNIEKESVKIFKE